MVKREYNIHVVREKGGLKFFMKKRNKKTFSIIKMLVTALILFLFSGVGVLAVATKVNTVTITLSNGYKMTVLTNKTKVEDILKENNILLKKDEKVAPANNENITGNGKIVISNKSKQEVEVAKVSESGIETTLDSLLEAYDTIIERIEVVKEKIPFETVKKDISKGKSATKNKVLQQGKNGIKEVTYKVKYQNNTEVERIKVSEKITKKPVNKIVQVASVKVTSREEITTRTSDTSKTSSSGSPVKVYKVTAYCACAKCCGKSTGRTASGTRATAGRTIAAPSTFAFGTKLLIKGKEYVVEDRGGAIKGNRIDIYMTSHSAAMAWGVKYLPVQVKK